MQLNSREAIVHAVVQGIGVGFVSAVEYAEQPGTKAVSFIEDPLHIHYFLCCLGCAATDRSSRTCSIPACCRKHLIPEHQAKTRFTGLFPV